MTSPKDGDLPLKACASGKAFVEWGEVLKVVLKVTASRTPPTINRGEIFLSGNLDKTNLARFLKESCFLAISISSQIIAGLGLKPKILDETPT